MLFITERCQSTQCIRGCCHRTVPMINPSTAKVHTIGTWASILEYGAVEEHWLIWWIWFSFRPGGWRVCCSPEEEMAAGGAMGRKQAGGGSVMICLETLDLGMLLWHVPPSTKIVADHGHSFMAMCSLMAITSLRRINAMFEECLRNMDKCSRCCLGLQTLLWSHFKITATQISTSVHALDAKG